MDYISKFKESQFNTLTSQGYSFFVLNNNKYNRNNTVIYASISKPKIKDHIVVCEIISFSELLKYDVNYVAINVIDKDANKRFFISYLQENPKERKKILSSSWRTISNFDLKDYYIDILSSQHHNTIHDFIKFFNSCFSITEWKCLRLPLEDFQTNLLLKNWTKEESYLFWFNFLKARKKQINNHQIAPKVAEFLLNNVSEQQIASFFPFFSYLRAKFETIEPDIFENEYQFTTVLSLNLKKMFDTFCIREYSRHSYAEAIKHFMYGVQEYYYIDYAEDVYENKQRGSLHITFYHNNPQFTVKEGKRLIIDFFNHLKLNHPDTLNISFVSKWLEFDSLNQSLKQKENKLIQKVKKI